jgi:multidrug efflux pump subunit AcrA (membrane-fusion protein)
MLLLPGCGGVEDDGTTYTVSRGDFKNIITIDGVVESIHSTAVLCPDKVGGIVSFLIEDGTWVEEGDTLCVIDAGDTESIRLPLITEIETQEALLATTIAANNMELALLESQFDLNEADTRIAQMDSLQLLFMSAGERRIQELELQKVALQKRSFDEKLKALPIIQKAGVQAIQRNIAMMKDYLKMLDDAIASLVILAPKDGLAIRANTPNSDWDKLTEGKEVWMGHPVVIMPDMDSFKVKMYVPETSFKHINQDDSITYRFHAMPGETAYGKVTNKVMAGVPISRGSKVKVFEIEASMDSVTRKPEPGFSVDCNILIQEQKDVLSIPQVAMFQNDSIKVVYVKSRSGYEERQVETGLASQTHVVITAGLEDGEQISYLRPKASLVKRTTLLPEAERGSDDAENAEAAHGVDDGSLTEDEGAAVESAPTVNDDAPAPANRRRQNRNN